MKTLGIFKDLQPWLMLLFAGLPFSRGFADFRENEVSESTKKKTQLIRKKKKKKSGPI